MSLVRLTGLRLHGPGSSNESIETQGLLTSYGFPGTQDNDGITIIIDNRNLNNRFIK